MSGGNGQPLDRGRVMARYHDELRTVRDCHATEYGITPRLVEAEIRARLLADILDIKDPRPLWDRL